MRSPPPPATPPMTPVLWGISVENRRSSLHSALGTPTEGVSVPKISVLREERSGGQQEHAGAS